VLLRAQFPDGYWETLLDQDVPRAMLSTMAWLHEQDAFYFNRRWLNDYLVLADDRETVNAITKGMGYRMRPPTAASAAIRAYPNPTQPVSVVIPAGTAVPYGDTYFEFLEDATIPAFANFWPDSTTDELIVVTEGITKEVTFISDGTPYQRFLVPFENVIEGSVVITVADEEWEETDSVVYIEGDALARDVFTGDGTDNQEYLLTRLNAIADINNNDKPTVLIDGVEWIQVTNYTGGPEEFKVYQDAAGNTWVRFGLAADGSAPAAGAVVDCIYLLAGAQKRYELTYSDTEQPTVAFGNDDNGKIPPIGAEVKVVCRVGGGVVGNIEPGALDLEVQGYIGAAPDPAAGVNPESTPVRIVNYSKGTGGNPREAIDHAQHYAPRYVQANNRAVTRNDWEVLASTYYDPRYGAPAYAAAKLHQEVPESNQIDVALWSRDTEGRLTTAGESLKAAVRKFLQARRLQCVYEEMVDGTTYYFDVYLSVSLQRNFFATTVFSQLTAIVQQFFDSALVMPGRDVRINELFRKLNSVEGVYSVNIDSIIGSEKEELSQTADGVSAEFSFEFTNPLGQAIVPETIIVEAETQEASDDGEGVMSGDVDTTGTNTADYDTGKVTVTFTTVPTLNATVAAEARYKARLEWEEDLTLVLPGIQQLDRLTEYLPIIQRPPIGVGDGLALDFYLPSYLMPVVAGRCFFIGGYGAPVPSPSGDTLLAYDDGKGNIVGDVDPTATNTIDYRTGRVQFTWIALPYYNPVVNYTAQLTQNADGVRTEFDFTVPGWPAGVPSPVPVGNVKMDFSAYPSWGAEAVLYVNWQDQVFGFYLDNRGDSTFNTVSGAGKLYFAVPPQSPGAPPHQFPLSFAPVTTMLYSAFVFAVEALTATGLELYLYADNEGKLWGTTPDNYPTSRLTHKTGHYLARLSSVIPTGQEVKVMYDAILQSSSKNIPIGANAIGTFGRTIITELEEEIDL